MLPIECYNLRIVKWFPKYLLLSWVVFGLGFAQTNAADLVRASAEVDSFIATFYIENISDCVLESVDVRVAHNSIYFSTDEKNLFVVLQPGETGAFATQLSQVVNDDWQWALDSLTLADCDDAGFVAFEKYDFGAPVATQANATFTTNPATSASRLIYTIEKGDTVFVIAAKFGLTARELMDANGLATEALIYGRTLNVPLTLADEGISYQTHTVSSGDTLFKIAQRYGVPMAAIQSLNCIEDEGIVKLEQDLLIPPEGVTDVVNSCV